MELFVQARRGKKEDEGKREMGDRKKRNGGKENRKGGKKRKGKKKKEEERKGKRKRKEYHAVSRLGQQRNRNYTTRDRFPPTLVILRLGAT